MKIKPGSATGLLHYTRTGGGKPPVMLLHGLAGDGATWIPVARGLADDFDVIMPDARGHGNSSVPKTGYRYDDHASDVEELINALELSRPILVGHSMGGMTAALVASRGKTRLNGLVLADPTFLSPEVQRQVHESDAAEKQRLLLEQSFEEVFAEARARHPHRSREILELIARARLRTSMNAFEVLTPPTPDYEAVVRGIGVPTLLVSGESGVVPREVAEALKDLNPRVEVETILGAGHGIHFDQPERFVEVARAFLKRQTR